ncbi:hypothetical protein [Nocardia iowensis]|uniref:DUF4304 domain-containing protein n=1 Tax=Nocardia iowensis TaxID=204891 RepID=A0ABX8S370_NOCIO|nr:hypothetical protein [Nocardia iowensis]QXN94336.1 hypothetical protein KV110_15530 [Nocardia iowensis]
MVGLDTALRRLLRETGKLLQPYGFHGAEPAWVRVEPGGVASVGRTRVSRTWTGGQQMLSFGLDLNATPKPWWEFGNWRNARLGLPPTPLEKATGPGLIDTRTLPAELTTMWSLRLDPEQPGQHVLHTDIDTIRAELPRRVHAYARRALRLVEPDRYLDELLTQPAPQSRTLEAIVVLLAARGPGQHLDEAFDQLRKCSVEPDASTDAEDVIAYAQTRAALA